MDELTVPFGSSAYWLIFAVAVFSRGMDMVSTRVATPNLVLEGNPIARWMGWTGGGVFNLAVCFAFAMLPLASIIVSTASLMVASRNFQQAWLMRVMGEDRYNVMFSVHMTPATRPLYLVCAFMQAILIVPLGVALICYGGRLVVPLGIGVGMIGYALIVLIFTVLSEWRRSR